MTSGDSENPGLSPMISGENLPHRPILVPPQQLPPKTDPGFLKIQQGTSSTRGKHIGTTYRKGSTVKMANITADLGLRMDQQHSATTYFYEPSSHPFQKECPGASP